MQSEDEWKGLKCLYKACQAAITDGGLLTDTGVNERGENERQSKMTCEMKTRLDQLNYLGHRTREPTRASANKRKESKRKAFSLQ